MLHRSLFILVLYLVQVFAKKDCKLGHIYDPSISETTASLGWQTNGTQCENDQKYKIQLDEVLTSTSSILFTTENTTETNKNYATLKPCTTYMFRIWLILGNGTIVGEMNRKFVYIKL